MSAAAPGLRLRAADAEDFGVLSACLQDALVPLAEIAFDAAAHEFLLVASRFRWEAVPEGNPAPPGERVGCVVRFTGVTAVRRRGLDLRARAEILSLLTIEIQTGALVLHFAGDAAIRLEGAAIACGIADLGEPWPAAARPRHPES